MNKDIIHFAHGNGFPSPCYRQVMQRLAENFECCYIDRIGHNERFPVTENWHYLVHEVIASIQQQTSRPVIAVGHSLGGVLSILAAMQNPTLFKAVILLDAPLIGRIKSNLVRLSKMLGMIDLITPAFRTRNRRQFWPDREQAMAYLQTKTLFRHFAPACLNDYIDFGLRHDKDGYHLRFDPDIEYNIYRTLPHCLYRYQGQLITPTTLIYGKQSKIIDQHAVHYMKTKFGIRVIATEGTHMFPLEYPVETARLIEQAIQRILSQSLGL